jgi:TonB family protein
VRGRCRARAFEEVREEGSSGLLAQMPWIQGSVPSVLCPQQRAPLIYRGTRETDDMRRGFVLVALAFIVLVASIGNAQNAPAATNSDRKVSSRVSPSYPELAKKMHIHGMVRVEAVVKANGSVKTTRVLGGNPVLVDAAIDAVGKWKFEPGQNETTEIVQLAFESQ